jgi:hypothetical protein
MNSPIKERFENYVVSGLKKLPTKFAVTTKRTDIPIMMIPKAESLHCHGLSPWSLDVCQREGSNIPDEQNPYGCVERSPYKKNT